MLFILFTGKAYKPYYSNAAFRPAALGPPGVWLEVQHFRPYPIAPEPGSELAARFSGDLYTC